MLNDAGFHAAIAVLAFLIMALLIETFAPLAMIPFPAVQFRDTKSSFADPVPVVKMYRFAELTSSFDEFRNFMSAPFVIVRVFPAASLTLPFTLIL